MAVEIAPSEPDLPNIRKHLLNKGPLWRLGAWGGCAAIALAALAFTTQTERGSERLQLAFAPEPQPARAVAMAEVTPRAPDKDAETQRLEAQVRLLAADRDRLTARLASLERNLEDMTGSIKRQAAQQEAAMPATVTPAPAPRAPATTPPIAATAPAPSPPASVPEASMPTPIAIAPLAMPAGTDTAAAWPGTPATQSASPEPEPVPLPPTRIAAAPATEPTAEPPRKPEIGVDLGGAPSMEVLNLRWAAVKANFGPLLTGLHPLAAHVRRPGSTDVRLLAGPLPNAAAATQLCSRFAAARVTCRVTKFEGEHIAQR